MAKRERKNGDLPLALEDAMGNWFSENASLGSGDLRGPITLEVLSRSEHADSWTICNRKVGRSEVMEMIIDLVATGYSIPLILEQTGMPKPRTIMNWIRDYKPFAEMLEVAEQMYAMIQVHQAKEIVDGSTDEKQAFRDKVRADIRLRLAEIHNPKKYGRKQLVDVTHHNDNLSEDELVTRLRSVLVSHKSILEEKLGIQIIIPCQDAEIVSVESADEKVVDPMMIGMQGSDDTPEETDFDDLGGM